jgi:hypothetical protein
VDEFLNNRKTDKSVAPVPKTRMMISPKLHFMTAGIRAAQIIKIDYKNTAVL